MRFALAVWLHFAGTISPDGGRPAPAVARDGRADGGNPVAHLGDDDREVIENLDLLEHLDESRDLDLLVELSKEPAQPK